MIDLSAIELSRSSDCSWLSMFDVGESISGEVLWSNGVGELHGR